MEYNSQVPVDLHRKILTLVHEDDALELDNVLKSLIGTELEITESTFFMVHVKRNLLHIASYNQARNCVHLLVHAPYSWNVDCLDGVNRSPCHYAESRDDLSLFTELAAFSCERHAWGLEISPSVSNGNLVTILFWPQDLIKRPLGLIGVVGLRSIGISGCFRYMDEQFVYKTHLIGPLVALLFELYMANPELFNFNLWTGEQVQGEFNYFWPIPQSILNVTDDFSAHDDCELYPHCLYQTTISGTELGVTDQKALHRLVRVWLSHRFGCYKPSQSDSLRIGTVLSLKDFCRNYLRHSIVRHMAQCKIEKNYLQVLQSMGLPNSLKEYLLYRSIWDLGTSWEFYLTNGSGGNVPCGSKVTIKRTAADDPVQGIFIGHRFIPDC